MVISTPLAIPAARAGDSTQSTLARPYTLPTSPPDYPDSVRVAEGCYISTVAYLAKFAAAFPSEIGSPLTVRPKPYPTPHTIALMTWLNEWWLRDEFLGVIRLNLRVATREITDDIARRAEAVVQRRALGLSPSARARIANSGLHDTGVVDASREVVRAAKLLPFASELFRIESRGKEIHLLFFRPRPGYIAVYDPVCGTATAMTEVASSIKAVELVAERLGYSVASIRPDDHHVLAAVTR